MSVDTDYISHIKKNGSNAGLEGMELTGKRSYYMRGRRKSERGRECVRERVNEKQVCRERKREKYRLTCM